jgi:hypothetical protein
VPDPHELVERLFSADTEDEKIEAFDASTAALILRQMGASPARVRTLQGEYGEAFGTEWLTDAYGLAVDLWVTRCFNYSFETLFTKPTKCPVLAKYDEHVAERTDDLDRYMVFKAYGMGRMVATSKVPARRPYICSRQGDSPVFIASFDHFFTDLFGEDLDL